MLIKSLARKIVALVIALILIISLIPSNLFKVSAAENAIELTYGTTTKNFATWNAFSSYVRGTAAAQSGTAKLNEDVAASAGEIIPMFKGTFDGNNKTITLSGGVMQYSSTMNWAAGLFAELDGATILDLNVKVAGELKLPLDQSSGSNYKVSHVGIIAGRTMGSRITNCSVLSVNSASRLYAEFHNSGSGAQTECAIGGVVGRADTTTISGCYSDLALYGRRKGAAATINMGGIVGHMVDSELNNSIMLRSPIGYLSNNTSTYHLEVPTDNGYGHVGGLVGEATSNSRLTKSYVGSGISGKELGMKGSYIGYTCGSTSMSNYDRAFYYKDFIKLFGSTTVSVGTDSSKYKSGISGTTRGQLAASLGSEWLVNTYYSNTQVVLKRMAATLELTRDSGSNAVNVSKVNYPPHGMVSDTIKAMHYRVYIGTATSADWQTGDTTTEISTTADTGKSVSVLATLHDTDLKCLDFLAEASLDFATSKQTAKPNINLKTTGTLADGILITGVTSAKIFYKYVPDGESSPDVLVDSSGMAQDGATEVSPGVVLTNYPNNCENFTIYAQAYVSGEVPSGMQYATYGKAQRPASPPPVLKIQRPGTDAKEDFNSNDVYPSGTKLFFSPDLPSTPNGDYFMYFMNSDNTPTESTGTKHESNEPFHTLRTDVSEVKINAIMVKKYYPQSEVRTFIIKVKTPWEAPPVNPSPESPVRSGTEVLFTIHPDNYAPMCEDIDITNNTALVDQINNALPGDEMSKLKSDMVTVTGDGGSKTVTLKNTLILTAEEIGNIPDIGTLPKARYLIGDAANDESIKTSQDLLASLSATNISVFTPNIIFMSNGKYSVHAVKNAGTAIKITGKPDDRIPIKVALTETTSHSMSSLVKYEYKIMPVAGPITITPAANGTTYTPIRRSDVIQFESEADTDVYYTTNGTTPDPSNYGGDKPTQKYTVGHPIPVSTIMPVGQNSVTIKAVVMGAGVSVSAPSSFLYQIAKAATPKATPSSADGSITPVTGASIITLQSDPDVDIYYTVDGTLPDPTDDTGKTSKYNGSGIDVSQLLSNSSTFTLKVMASSENYAPSDVVSFRYQLARADQPTAVPETSISKYTEVSGSDTIQLFSLPGTEVYYTTNGDIPNPDDTSGSTQKYNRSKAIAVKDLLKSDDTVFTIRAVAVGNGYSSSLPVDFYYRLAKATPPKATPEPAEEGITVVSEGALITLYSATPGADIYYTLDNSMPNVAEAGQQGKSTKKYAAPGIVMPNEPFLNIRAMTHVPASGGAAGGLYRDSDPIVFSYRTPAAIQAVYTTPIAGLVQNNTSVTLKTSASGARIFYKLLYEVPSAGVTVEAEKDQLFDEKNPIKVTKNTWIMAMSELDGAKSIVTTHAFAVAPTLKAPTASIASGTTVIKGTKLELTSSDSGGEIYYTKDGSDPKDSQNNAAIAGETVLLDGDYGASMTIKACAKGAEFTTSEVATFTYTILKEGEDIKASIASGTAVKKGTEVTISSTLPNVLLYCTTDGSQPSKAGKEGGKVIITGQPDSTCTVKVLMVVGEMTAEKTFTYKLIPRAAAPTSNIPTGSVVLDGAHATLKATEGRIYYTTDGTDPTAASIEYTNPIDVSQSMVLKAIAVVDGKEISEIVEYSYNRADQVGAPVFSKTSGEIVIKTQIEITSSTEAATIYYTTDGTAPTKETLSSCTVYNGPITVTRPVTIKAMAVSKGLHDSVVNSATYTVVEPVEPPVEEENTELPKNTTTDRLQSRRAYSNENTGPTFKENILTDTTSNVMLATNNGVIPKGSRLVTQPIESTETDKKAVNASLGYEIVNMYDISLESDGTYIQPDGDIEIGVPIPAEYENAIVVVCYLADDGTVEALPTRRSGNMAYVIINHLSKYAVTVPSLPEKAGLNAKPIVFIAVGILAVLAAGVVIFRIVKIKKGMVS